jgi:hypothetical protein
MLGLDAFLAAAQSRQLATQFQLFNCGRQIPISSKGHLLPRGVHRVNRAGRRLLQRSNDRFSLTFVKVAEP